MKANWISPVFAAVAVLSIGAGVGACTTSTRTQESTGQYMDDTAISTKVRANILAEPGVSITQIDVTTYKGVVQLSGFVDSSSSKLKAGQVASSVNGVRSVQNNIIVK